MSAVILTLRTMAVFGNLLVVVLYAVASFCKSETPFNAAYRRPVEANTTCGSPSAEEFYTIQEAIRTVFESQRVIQICNASDPGNAHPPSYLVDGLLETFWQSRQRTETASIVINLEQMIFASRIILRFGDQQRPGTIQISKSSDHGVTYTPWYYLVSWEEQCQSVFNVQGVASVPCKMYLQFPAKKYNEIVTIELNGQFQNNGDANAHSPGLLAWMNVTNIMFKFANMHWELDRSTDRLNHYTVREIEVQGRCDCNGHANGNICPYNETTKQRSCVCQGNTCGINCEKCCPLYNQLPWNAGSKAPWQSDNTSSCEQCNCHDHSDACSFNQTVSDLGLSLDTHGRRRGGGVCQACKHNTHGVNCEKCEVFYYRPTGRSHSRIDACQACACDARGVTNVTGVKLLDCVTDDNATSLFPGKKPGDCFCKSRVEGRQCDSCKQEYYGLSHENPAGCLECACHLSGTVNGSNICDSGPSGQCTCKDNVELRNCSQCKHGFYDLQNSTIEGCNSCNCDPGGTYPQDACDKETGQCKCRPEVTGKQCDSVKPGNLYPNLHFLKATKDPYQPAKNLLNVSINITKTGSFMVITEYTLTVSQSVILEVQVRPADGSSGSPNNVSVSLPQCSNCKDQLFSSVNLTAGEWLVYLYGNDSNLYLYDVVALPEEFIKGGILGSKNQAFQFECSVVANDMRIGTDREEFCRAGVFSLTVAYMNGGTPCNCHPLGSINSSSCNPYGGQCTCKTGVEARDCGRCKPEFYNLTSDGCKPCGCKGPNKVCDPVSGDCKCPANTVGRTCNPCECNGNSNKCLPSGECLHCQHNSTGFYCDECSNGTYGNATSGGQCQDCGCSTNGSIKSVCDRITGQCHCKANVMGRNCSQCKPNTHGFGPAGCSECMCNPYGSQSLQCDNSGICNCKADANGTKCTQCLEGYYGLPNMACQACNCNLNGTVNGTTCASDAYGQCVCKTGVTGRACDTCEKYSTKFSSSGCVTCPVCVHELMRTLENTTTERNTSYSMVLELKSLTEMHRFLDQTEEKIRTVKAEEDNFYPRISNAQNESLILRNSSLTSANRSYFDVNKQNTEHEANVFLLSLNTSDAFNKTTSLLENTNRSVQNIHGLDGLIDAALTDLKGKEAHGASALLSSKEAISNRMVRDFLKEMTRINKETSIANNITTQVRRMAEEVLSQRTQSRDLDGRIENTTRSLTELQREWNRTHAQFLQSVQDLLNQLSAIREHLNLTQEILQNETEILHFVNELNGNTNRTLNSTIQTLQEGAGAVELMTNGSVNSSSGLVEVSNNLQNKITTTHALLEAAEANLLQAQNHSRLLRELADEIARVFNACREYGAQSVDSIKRFKEIDALVNSSIAKSNDAKILVERLIKRFQNQSDIPELIAEATRESQRADKLHNKTFSRDLLGAENDAMLKALDEANATFLQAVPLWYEAYNQYPALREIATRLQAASSEAPGVVESLAHAEREVSLTKSAVDVVTAALNDLATQISDLEARVTFIQTAAANQSGIINEAFQRVQEASLIVSNETTAPSTSVLKALAIQNSLKIQGDQINGNLDRLEATAKALDNRLRKLPLARTFSGDDVAKFNLSSRTLNSRVNTEISMSIKPNNSDGLLLSIMDQSPGSSQPEGLALYLQNAHVVLEYDVGKGPDTLANPLKLPINEWSDIVYTRFGSSVSLSVATASVTKTVQKGPLIDTSGERMDFTSDWDVTLGGYSVSKVSNIQLGNFSGDIAGLEIDQEEYYLFNTKSSSGDAEYTLPPKRLRYYPDNGKIVSCSGAGLLQQRLPTNFNTSASYFAIEFDFRTHDRDGYVVELGEMNRQDYSVYLLGGAVVFTRPNSSFSVTSNGSNYYNGQWHHLKAAINETHVELILTGSGSTDKSSNALSSGMRNKEGTLITFCARAQNRQSKLVPETFFAGDIKNAKLFQFNDSHHIAWSFKTPAPLMIKETFTKEVFLGQTEGGATRFYGLAPPEDSPSYSIITPPDSRFSSIEFTFKTFDKNGILLYSEAQVSDKYEVLYLGLWHGHVMVISHNTSVKQSVPFVSDHPYSDNVWRTVKLNHSDEEYFLYVDEAPLHHGWFNSATKSVVNLGSTVYIGCIPGNVTLKILSPVTWCYEGDVKELRIDGIAYNLLSESFGLSNAGVLAANPRPLPTPVPETCGAASLPLVPLGGPRKGFTAGIGNHAPRSYMAFDDLDKEFITNNSQMAIQLTVTPLSGNGLLLYIADSRTRPQQFLAFELVDGKLRYQFNHASGHVTMMSSQKYQGKSDIKTIRVDGFGALLFKTPQGTQPKYTNIGKMSTKMMMNLKPPVYIGGVPTSVKIHPLVTSQTGFTGCIESVKLQTEKTSNSLDLANPAQSGNLRSCFKNAEPGLGFNGTSAITLDKVSITHNFSLVFDLRTWKRSGLIFHFTSGGINLTLEQSSGQLNLSSVNISAAEVMSTAWKDPSRVNASKTSHLLCNMEWHTVSITRHDNHLKMTVSVNNQQLTETLPLQGGVVFDGGLSFGGGTGGFAEGFYGCIRNAKINKKLVDFSQAKAATSVQFGCPTRSQ